VLRLASPLETLGGGRILEESRYRLKRFKAFVIDELGRLEQSLESPLELLEVVLARSGAGLQAEADLAVAIKRAPAETRELLAELASRGSAVRDERTQRWLHVDALEGALERLVSAVRSWFDAHPLRQRMEVRELRSALGLEQALLAFLLEEGGVRGELVVHSGGWLSLAGREVELDPGTRELVERLESALDEAGFQPPDVAELAERLGTTAEGLRPVLELLVDAGRVVPLDRDLYLAEGRAARAREAVRENCERHGHLEIPELRDALGTSRKFLIPLLERFDLEGLTLRQGGHRVLKRS
jgi:selenocysteine-specific elongation factor